MKTSSKIVHFKNFNISVGENACVEYDQICLQHGHIMLFDKLSICFVRDIWFQLT